MPIPQITNIESPILQELFAVGGTDDVQFLYQRLISYFPSLSDAEIRIIKSGEQKFWKKAIQKAGKKLDNENLIKRNRGVWTLTEKGKQKVIEETEGIVFTQIVKNDSLTHSNIQLLIVKLGKILGFYSESEFQYYDVIWRESINNQRLSHVFEVQSKGNIDSAFAKLKRAYDTQRSNIFLVLDSERDANRAIKSLNLEFRELDGVLTILTFVEIRKIHENLAEIAEYLPKLLKA